MTETEMRALWPGDCVCHVYYNTLCNYRVVSVYSDSEVSCDFIRVCDDRGVESNMQWKHLHRDEAGAWLAYKQELEKTIKIRRQIADKENKRIELLLQTVAAIGDDGTLLDTVPKFDYQMWWD